MGTQNGTTVDLKALARKKILKEAEALHNLYSEPAIDAATALLVDLYETGLRHGCPVDEWGGVTNLPMAALMAPRWWHTDIPQTGEDAVVEMDRLVDELGGATAGVHRHVLRVRVPRIDSTPRWGGVSRADLAVSIDVDHGWFLTPYADGYQRTISVTAPYGTAGARAVAAVVRAVLAGEHGDPFRAL